MVWLFILTFGPGIVFVIFIIIAAVGTGRDVAAWLLAKDTSRGKFVRWVFKSGWWWMAPVLVLGLYGTSQLILLWLPRR